MLFAFVVIAIVAIVCYGVLGNAVMVQSKKKLNAVQTEMQTILKSDTSQDEVLNKIIGFAFFDRVDVFVFTADGDSVISSAALPENAQQWLFMSVEEHVGTWTDGKSFEYNLGYAGNNSICNVTCIEYSGEECFLLTRFPVTVITGVVNQIGLYILLIAAITLVLAFFISYVLAKRLSDPIRQVSVTAQKLAKGDYDVQFNSLEYAEIAKLSDTLNYMKDEIKKSDDFQKEILANVTHDLKTPLTMIKAYASMIKEISGNDPEKREKHLQIIIDESDRLTGLVNDILNTSKISAGIDNVSLKVINLTELVYGIIDSFGYLQETQGYSLLLDIDTNLYTLADEEKIKQVVYNFISNAVNYTGEDKCVYISLKYSAEENRIKFSVRDTGKGIPEDELNAIWDRYYRSRDTHARPVKGTGLGLNICKIILNAHAFNFGVLSEEGKGSTFYVDFPVERAEP